MSQSMEDRTITANQARAEYVAKCNEVIEIEMVLAYLETALVRGLRVAEYSANLVKKAVVGAGHAEKSQVQMMVRRLLPGCAIAEPDAADALAVAICHAHTHATSARLKIAR